MKILSFKKITMAAAFLTCIQECSAHTDWEHIRTLPAHFQSTGGSTSYHRPEVMQMLSAGKKVAICIHNEFGMDPDNVLADTLAAQIFGELQQANPTINIKNHVHFATTYVGAEELAPYAKLAFENMRSDSGPIENGIANVYAGYQPRTQTEFKDSYRQIPGFFGDIETTEEDVVSNKKSNSDLMFNSIPRKAHGAFDRNLGEPAAYALDVKELLELKEVCDASDLCIHIIMAPANNLESFNLRPQDKIYIMGGTYQRGTNPETLGYNFGASIVHVKRLLDHAEACGTAVFMVNSGFCDGFKVSKEFWYTLIINRDRLNLTPFQKSLIEHSIHWEAYMFNRLTTDLNDDISLVFEKQKVPIFSDPLTVLIALKEIFSESVGLPELNGKIYTLQEHDFKLNDIPAGPGGYPGTHQTDSDGNKIGYLQHPSEFFTKKKVLSVSDKPNCVITEPITALPGELRQQFTEYYFLKALCFSVTQREEFYRILTQ
jgi:hypothetical protein